MVVIPAGNFTMGSSAAEKSWAASHGGSMGAVADEAPQRQVSLPSFALGKYDVTRGEYAARLINSARNLFHRTILMTLYSTAVRRSELCSLKVTDIDSKRMMMTSSGSSTTGSRLGDLGNGMCSVRKWRRSVLTKKKRSAETYWLTVDALSFLVWNRYAWSVESVPVRACRAADENAWRSRG